MGLPFIPCPPTVHYPDHRLTAISHGDILDHDALLAVASARIPIFIAVADRVLKPHSPKPRRQTVAERKEKLRRAS